MPAGEEQLYFWAFLLKNNNNNKFLYRGKEENKTDYTASNSNQSVLALLYILYISDTPAPASPLRVGWADAALRPSHGDNAVPNGGDTGGGGQGGVIYTMGAHTYIFIVSGGPQHGEERNKVHLYRLDPALAARGAGSQAGAAMQGGGGGGGPRGPTLPPSKRSPPCPPG